MGAGRRTRVEFGLLGPLMIRRDGERVEVGAPKQRTLLILLLLRPNQTVPVDRLIEGLWEDDPPPRARVTLRSYVSSLRRIIDEPHAEPVISSGANGYSLHVAPESIDAVRFERLVNGARRHLAAEDPQAALDGLDEAAGLWRGEALADVADSAFARGERTRLEELRLSAQEDRFDALLALDRPEEAVAALEAFTSAEPLRERARAQLMLGLYRSGRAPDALQAFGRFRETLVEELGLDPSPKLQALADRILRQASDLDLPTPVDAGRHPREAATPLSPLVGRIHERRELQASLKRVRAGEGDLLLLAGEPGIGKTALLEELGRHAAAAGVAVAWGRCHETRGAPAFWPWIQIIRDIAAGLSDEELRTVTSGPAGPVTQLVQGIAQRLGEQRLALGDDLEAARFQLYDAIATFLLRVAERRPLVLVLDDLHWADTPSLQTLAFLAPLMGSGGLLAAGSYRDVRADWTAELEATLATVVREPSTRQLGLVGLQPAAVAELAEAVTGKAISGAELELLHQRTAGNPFFVRQLSQLLEEADTGLGAIPAGVRHVIGRRLSMLPAEVRDVLEAAAVMGGQFDLRPLAAATGTTPSQALEAAGRAAAHGLVVAVEQHATSYRFIHALVRETIYEGLSPHRAVQLHAHVAGVLESMPGVPVAALAEHFWRAADVIDDDRPVGYLLTAADRALEVLAHEEAESYLRRALQVVANRAVDPSVEIDVRLRLIQLVMRLRGWASEEIEEIAAPARALARASGLPADHLPLWHALLAVTTGRGNLRAARELAVQLLADPALADHAAALALGHSALAYNDLAAGGDPAAALDHAMQAQRWAELAPPAQLDAIPGHLGVMATYVQALALAHQDDGAAAIEASRRSLALAQEVDDPLALASAYLVGALAAVLLGATAFARELTGPGLEACERYGLQLIAEMMTVSDSWARARLGEDPAEHADRMERAVESVRRSGHRDTVAKYLLFTAETYLLAGDTTAAGRCLEEATALSGRTGESLPVQRLLQIEAAFNRRR